MKLTDLQALLWLARCGSLQAAAQASGVSRTTLRRRLDRLRTAVGEPLFLVGSQGLLLTPVGELLARRAPRLLSQRETLLQEAQRLASQPTGQLRVLVATGFPPMFITQVLASVTAAAPELHLDLHHDPKPLERLDEGFDLVVHWGEPPPPRDGYSRVLLRQPQRLMAAPAYLERRGTPSSLAELSEHTLLHAANTPSAWPSFGAGELPIVPTHTVDDLYLLGCLVGAGLGIALLPRSGVGLDASVDALVPVLDDLVGDDLVVRAFLPMQTLEGGATRSVLEIVRILWGAEAPTEP